MDRLERKLAGRVDLLRLSAWGQVGRQLGARYGIRGVPTFLLFDADGSLVYYQVGRLDSERILAEIDGLGR